MESAPKSLIQNSLAERIHFGNLVENIVDGHARGRALVSKVEKSEELFALEMKCGHRSFST